MHAIILAGGNGRRLWPKTSSITPKPFIKLEDGESLLQKSVKRAFKIPETKKCTIIVENKNYKLALDHIKKIDIPNLQKKLDFIVEPSSQDTAAACCLGALHAKGNNILIMPTDQTIDNLKEFLKPISLGNFFATKKYITIFGVNSVNPSTSYGYVGINKKAKVEFKEKPQKNLALHYHKTKNYFWNSGIILCNSKVMLDSINQYANDIYESVVKSYTNVSIGEDSGFKHFIINKKHFESIQKISIDYAVLEKVDNLKLIPCDIKWQDVGTWSEFSKIFRKDINNNSVIGNASILDTKNCYIENNKENLITIGLRDLIIVNSPSGILIADKTKQDKITLFSNLLKL